MSDMPRKPKVGDSVYIQADVEAVGSRSLHALVDNDIYVKVDIENHGTDWRFADETPAPNHDVCENSRDCIICRTRILPAAGICFSCAERKPRELTDEESNTVGSCPDELTWVEPDAMRSIILKYEAMRPGLLEGGE